MTPQDYASRVAEHHKTPRHVVVVTGARDWVWDEPVRTRLGRYPRGTLVIHGACVGLDLMAAMIAEELGHFPFPVPYFRSYGRAGGPARNAAMIAAGEAFSSPALDAGRELTTSRTEYFSVEGFHESFDALASSRGTYDCLAQALRVLDGTLSRVWFTTGDGATTRLVLHYSAEMDSLGAVVLPPRRR